MSNLIIVHVNENPDIRSQQLERVAERTTTMNITPISSTKPK